MSDPVYKVTVRQRSNGMYTYRVTWSDDSRLFEESADSFATAEIAQAAGEIVRGQLVRRLGD
jgi:hypothetical protein